jgi:hypothetical protein
MDVQCVSLSTASSMHVHGVTLSTNSSKDLHPFPPPAVLTCRVYPLQFGHAWCKYPFLNAGCRTMLHSVSPIYNEQKCRCWNQSGTGIRGPIPVPECYNTRLRYWMTEGRCPAINLATDLIRLFSVKVPTFRLFGNNAATLLVFTGQPVYICLF